MKFLADFWKQEEGQDLVEYSLLLGFVALAAVGSYTLIQGHITSIWTKTEGQIGAADAAVPVAP